MNSNQPQLTDLISFDNVLHFHPTEEKYRKQGYQYISHLTIKPLNGDYDFQVKLRSNNQKNYVVKPVGVHFKPSRELEEKQISIYMFNGQIALLKGDVFQLVVTIDNSVVMKQRIPINLANLTNSSINQDIGSHFNPYDSHYKNRLVKFEESQNDSQQMTVQSQHQENIYQSISPYSSQLPNPQKHAHFQSQVQEQQYKQPNQQQEQLKLQTSPHIRKEVSFQNTPSQSLDFQQNLQKHQQQQQMQQQQQLLQQQQQQQQVQQQQPLQHQMSLSNQNLNSQNLSQMSGKFGQQSAQNINNIDTNQNNIQNQQQQQQQQMNLSNPQLQSQKNTPSLIDSQIKNQFNSVTSNRPSAQQKQQQQDDLKLEEFKDCPKDQFYQQETKEMENLLNSDEKDKNTQQEQNNENQQSQNENQDQDLEHLLLKTEKEEQSPQRSQSHQKLANQPENYQKQPFQSAQNLLQQQQNDNQASTSPSKNNLDKYQELLKKIDSDKQELQKLQQEKNKMNQEIDVMKANMQNQDQQLQNEQQQNQNQNQMIPDNLSTPNSGFTIMHTLLVAFISLFIGIFVSS